MNPDEIVWEGRCPTCHRTVEVIMRGDGCLPSCIEHAIARGLELHHPPHEPCPGSGRPPVRDTIAVRAPLPDGTLDAALVDLERLLGIQDVRIYSGRTREPMNDPEVLNLKRAVRAELICLWYDLFEQVHYAANGEWSTGCDRMETRIKVLTRFVGPTPWEEVQVELLERGIYQRIQRELGILAPVDMDAVARLRARIDASASTMRGTVR